MPSTASGSASDRKRVPGRALDPVARTASFRQALSLLAQCERRTRGPGSWLAYCEREEIFLFPTREFVDETARLVRTLAPRRIVEVCAGRGTLSRALRAAGLDLTATDPRGGGGVEKLDVPETLARHRPDLVIGAWVPSDIGADHFILACPSVRWYLLIVAEVNGVLFPPDLLAVPGVRARELPKLARWTVSRLDYLTEFTRGELVQHARVVFFEKEPPVKR
ncbi:MAG: hypothetical protein V2A58_12050 [Planctomycetota bacterium]